MAHRVAIIGAGPAGGIALDSFLKAGYKDVTLFDRQRSVGGTWSLDEDIGFKPSEDVPGIERLGSKANPPIDIPAGVDGASESDPLRTHQVNYGTRFEEANLYRQVETNVLAELMNFSDNPFPAVYPAKSYERFGVDDAFRTQDVIRAYVRNYYVGREKYLKLRTTVERAYQPNGIGTPWRLVLRRRGADADKDEWWSQDFDFLYAATGRFNVPYVPNIEGLKDAVDRSPRGTITHTKVFREPSDFQNKRVVVVGASFSNVDVVHLIHDAGAQSPVHVALNTVLPPLLPHFAQPWIEPHSKVKKVIYDSNKAKLTIVFADDSVVHDVDKLVLGTGYQYTYPYLEDYVSQFGGIVNQDGRGTHNLYWSTWWKYDSSLAISSNIVDAIFWRFIEIQAKATANLWQLKHEEWPTVREAEEWENKRRSETLFDFHIWYPQFDKLIRGIANVGKIKLGSLPDFVHLYDKGIGLKADYNYRRAQKELADHPELRDRYEATLKYLKEHQAKPA